MHKFHVKFPIMLLEMPRWAWLVNLIWCNPHILACSIHFSRHNFSTAKPFEIRSCLQIYAIGLSKLQASLMPENSLLFFVPIPKEIQKLRDLLWCSMLPTSTIFCFSQKFCPLSSSSVDFSARHHKSNSIELITERQTSILKIMQCRGYHFSIRCWIQLDQMQIWRTRGFCNY